jgi:hypothetical protein
MSICPFSFVIPTAGAAYADEQTYRDTITKHAGPDLSVPAPINRALRLFWG